MAFEVQALITDEGNRRTTEGWATGKSFVVTGFTIGNAGHDPLDPTTALTPDPGATSVASPVFGPRAVSGFTYANDSCPIWECKIGFGEGVSLFSSIGLIAQILTSPVPSDPEIGNTFLFALANFPQRPKLGNENLVIRVGVQR